MAGAAPIVDDLRAESDALDELVADLPAQRWTTATPAAGWTIAHQIAHLLWTDRVALIAVEVEGRCGRRSGSVRRRRSAPMERSLRSLWRKRTGEPRQLLRCARAVSSASTSIALRWKRKFIR